MRVRLVLDVGDFERYVVGRYFATPEKPGKRRATRSQVRDFAKAALRSACVSRAAEMRGKSRSTARRLLEGKPSNDAETLTPLQEEQASLF